MNELKPESIESNCPVSRWCFPSCKEDNRNSMSNFQRCITDINSIMFKLLMKNIKKDADNDDEAKKALELIDQIQKDIEQQIKPEIEPEPKKETIHIDLELSPEEYKIVEGIYNEKPGKYLSIRNYAIKVIINEFQKFKEQNEYLRFMWKHMSMECKKREYGLKNYRQLRTKQYVCMHKDDKADYPECKIGNCYLLKPK